MSRCWVSGTGPTVTRHVGFSPPAIWSFHPTGTDYADPALLCGLDYFDDYIDLILDGSTVEEREEAELAAIKTCYEFYADASVDFAAYNSVQNAADVNHIRQALGYDQIVYYGESYGTLLGQHVMRDYPEILTAVILDGAAPLDAGVLPQGRVPRLVPHRAVLL